MLYQGQFPLRISCTITIHKSQGNNLDWEDIYLGKEYKCNGLNPLNISWVRKLRHLILQPFSYERPDKLNQYIGLKNIHE